MNAPTSLHPSDQTLSSYGLGKLDDILAEAVNQHLEGCPDCRQRVVAMSSDSFLGRIRGARAAGSSTFGVSQTDGTPSDKRTSAPPHKDTMPPGLADHPDYEIKRELGRGGMGVVYLAHNKLMGRDEVLKVMGRQIMERPGVLDRFLREIRAVAKLRHPNIVTAYSAVRLCESIVFAMEYVQGLDLSKMIKTKGPLPVAHACNFVYQSALGLQHAHEEGLVHRDIKPGNLMLSRTKDKATVKVLDFGLAKVTREEKVDGALTNEGQALGTPDFIAPEQILDATSADIRADIYSLGCTLYYLLSGRPPFQENSLYDMFQAHISRNADPLNFVRHEVPAELAALVAKMMAKDPGRRFQTPGEVAEAVTPFFKKGTVAFKGTNPEVSGDGQRAAGRPASGAMSTPTQPETNAGGPLVQARKPAEPTVPAARWESLIEFKENDSEITPDKPKPTSAMESGGRPPWKSIPLVAAASLFGLVMLGVIIIIITKNSITTIDTDKGKATIIKTPPSGGSDGVPPRVPEIHDRALVDKPPVTPDGLDAKLNKPSETTIIRGIWTIEGDELVQSEEHGDATLAFGDVDWSDYDLTLEAKKVSGRGNGFQVLFHRLSSETFCDYALGDADNFGCTLSFIQKGQGSRTGDANKDNWAWGGVNLGQWYPIKLKVRKSHFECFFDNRSNPMFEESHSSFSHGRLALRTGGIQARFRHIKVTDPKGKALFAGLPDGVTIAIQAPQKVIKPSNSAVQKIGPIKLFNGKNLDGWDDKIQNGSKWEVSNGVLAGRGGGEGKPGVLVSQRQNLTDFRLRAEVRFPANGCGWIELRRSDASGKCNGYVVANGMWPLWGRSEPVGSVTKAADYEYGKRLGWDYRAYSPPVVVANTWNVIEVSLFENRIVTTLNGYKLSDYTDVRGSYDSGGIALVCQDTSHVEYRSVTVEDYAPATAEPVNKKPVSPPAVIAITNSIGMKLALIPTGKFQMGSPETAMGAWSQEKPQHPVRITNPFYLGVYEVTRGQFRQFVHEADYRTEAEVDGKGAMGWNKETNAVEQNSKFTWQNPGFEQTDEHPVVNVSWNDTKAFAEWLSRKEGKTYRLPTEAEWEYACRAQSTTRYAFGDDPEGLAAVANVADGTLWDRFPDSREMTIFARDGFVFTAPVGRFQPNAFGLYDMHGNVWEWCQDGAAADYYMHSPVDDPAGTSGTSLRVGRGGSWLQGPLAGRAAMRGIVPLDFRRVDVGFRLALVQPGR